MTTTVSDIEEIILDETTISRSTPDIEHERASAIYDLVQESHFRPRGQEDGGPFSIHLSLVEGRLVFDIKSNSKSYNYTHVLSLTPFKRTIADYFQICESHYSAIKSATAAQIEAIDMGRRGLHNEGSEKLMDRLKDKVELDMETARRLFTLVCVLIWRGQF